MKTLAALIALTLGTALHAADPKPYPLTTCIVTDNKLGSMGKIITKVHEGQEVKFCCKPCIKKFDANPSKFIGKLTK